MVNKQIKKEGEVQHALEHQLNSNEELLAFTIGYINGLTARPYYIGLTADRLILMPLKRRVPSGQVYSIRLEYIKSLKWSGFTSPSLRIRLPKDNAILTFRRRDWRKRAKELTNLATQTAPPSTGDTATRSQRQIQQSQDLHGIGFITSAQHLLNETLKTQPTTSDDPSMRSLREQLDEGRQALRAGASFLFGGIGVVILFNPLTAILVAAGALIIDLWIGISLWQGRSKWRL